MLCVTLHSDKEKKEIKEYSVVDAWMIKKLRASCYTLVVYITEN